VYLNQALEGGVVDALSALGATASESVDFRRAQFIERQTNYASGRILLPMRLLNVQANYLSRESREK
jgi:hypothetical protein